MRQLAMVAEPLAVIRRHHDGRRPRGMACGLEERAERLVDVCDLAVVRMASVFRIERRRGRVRRVRIEHVDPYEPAALAAANPLQRGGDHFTRRALGKLEVGVVAGAAEAGIVDLEPAAPPPPPLPPNPPPDS